MPKKAQSKGVKPKNKKRAVKPRAAAPTRLTGPPVISALPKHKPKLTMRPGPKPNSVRVDLVDYIGQLKTTAAAPARGQCIYALPFSPGRLEGSKLVNIASMYERYVVNELRFHFSAAVPTTVGGALVMAFDKDPADTIYDGEPAIRHAMGLSSMVQFTPWAHETLAVEKENEQNFYFTSAGLADGTSRLEYAGTYFVTITSPGTLTANQAIGDLWIDATITFYDPTWEPTDVSSVVEQTDATPKPLVAGVARQGFSGLSQAELTSETNVRFVPDPETIGRLAEEVGFVVPSGLPYHLNDVINGIAGAGASITAETIRALPMKSVADFFEHNTFSELTFNPAVKSSNAAVGTQPNWFADFDFSLPSTALTVDNTLFGTPFWYLMGQFSGVTGTYLNRAVTLTANRGHTLPSSMEPASKAKPKTCKCEEESHCCHGK